MSSPAVSVILSAYNNFQALTRALPFWQAQTQHGFELIIADDGSAPAAYRPFHAIAQGTRLTIRHIWHEDTGFNKCGMLNKAILLAAGERLLFMDADMLPRHDLIAQHLRLSQPNSFVSGGSHVNLSVAGQRYVESLSCAQVPSLFSGDALVRSGFIEAERLGRLTSYGVKAALKDLLTWRTRAFSGANASCWKADAIKINGFDEGWGYGGLDRDFGIRLSNAGVRSRRHQYSLVALHQEHPRPYKDATKVKYNKQRLRQRLAAGATRIERGVDQYQPEEIEIIWQN